MGGCITPEQRYAAVYNECLELANAYNLHEGRDLFMARCVRVQPGGYEMPMTGYNTGGLYGRADAFGPYGPFGPSWDQFNNQFNQPRSARPLITPPPR